MIEIITGRLQNQSELGNFQRRYIGDNDENSISDGVGLLADDADPLAHWNVEELTPICKSAIRCISPRRENRPTTILSR
jgi:hypothetical protein